MIEFRLRKFNYKVHFSLERVFAVKGVNSKLDDGHHFLMWDFDGVDLELVKAALTLVQTSYDLPDITVLTTKPGNYHAYSFKRATFIEARTILASTPYVDNKYLGVGIGRGYFTLRFAGASAIEYVGVLRSDTKADVTLNDAHSFIEYTKRG